MSDVVSPRTSLPACFEAYPGIVLALDNHGRITGSNGRLDREIDRDPVGEALADLLDDASSLSKWQRLLDAGVAASCELVFAAGDTLHEPRGFALLVEPDHEPGHVWLLEHWRDPRLDRLQQEVEGTNSELAATQRELVKERGRLAAALERLEAQHRETQRLSALVREQNAELERSNHALDEFAHAISHDLKAPLRAVANYARWLDEDAGDVLSADAREHLSLLQDRVTRMRRMIDGVLDYARAGRHAAQPEHIAVADVMADVLALLNPPPDVQLTVGELPSLLAARAPLQQVLLNLVGNAMRFAGRGTDAPARVVVSCRRDDGVCEFAVADNGPGIHARDQERIWKLFQQAHEQEQQQGTGIGLAIVRMLVEGQGGRVWVESQPGAGATFRFTWPDPPSQRTASVETSH